MEACVYVRTAGTLLAWHPDCSPLTCCSCLDKSISTQKPDNDSSANINRISNKTFHARRIHTLLETRTICGSGMCTDHTLAWYEIRPAHTRLKQSTSKYFQAKPVSKLHQLGSTWTWSGWSASLFRATSASITAAIRKTPQPTKSTAYSTGCCRTSGSNAGKVDQSNQVGGHKPEITNGNHKKDTNGQIPCGQTCRLHDSSLNWTVPTKP